MKIISQNVHHTKEILKALGLPHSVQAVNGAHIKSVAEFEAVDKNETILLEVGCTTHRDWRKIRPSLHKHNCLFIGKWTS